MNDPIRDAVHELVAGAPQPRPLPSSAPPPLPGPRSYRWVAVAGSVAVVAVGAIAIAAWPSGESEAPISSDTTLVATTAPSTSPPGAPTTTPPPTTTPASTAPPTTTPTTSTIPVTSTPPANRVVEYPVDIPAGSIAIDADDIVVAHLDGDLYLHPDALGGTPGEPVRLVDMADPRVEVEEGPGPNVVDAVAGTIDGSFVYGTCCEPVSGNLFAITAADGEAVPLAPGYWPVLSPDRQRLATLNLYSFESWTLPTATRASREIAADPGLMNAQQLVWSRDGESLYTLRFDELGWELVQISSSPPFELIAATTLALGSPIGSADSASLLGTDPDGNVVIRSVTHAGAGRQSHDPVTLQPVDAIWNQAPSQTGTQGETLSPDGDRLVWWNEMIVRVETPDGVGLAQIDLGGRHAWLAPSS
jgi:hypothetical protein